MNADLKSDGSMPWTVTIEGVSKERHGASVSTFSFSRVTGSGSKAQFGRELENGSRYVNGESHKVGQ